MVEARRSPLPREAQEQTTCDWWEERRGGGSGKSAFPGHQAAGGRFQKREVLSWGSTSCGRWQPGHQGGHGKSEGRLPYPGRRRGEPSLVLRPRGEEDPGGAQSGAGLHQSGLGVPGMEGPPETPWHRVCPVGEPPGAPFCPPGLGDLLPASHYLCSCTYSFYLPLDAEGKPTAPSVLGSPLPLAW